MSNRCEACGLIRPLNFYRGRNLCYLCIKAWHRLDFKINREATWAEFISPTQLMLTGELRVVPVGQLLKILNERRQQNGER